MKYAARTDVPAEKSRMEIERTLARYGANSFAYAAESTRAAVMFELSGRRIRFVVPFPTEEMVSHVGGRRRPKAQIQPALEQERRQRWRALSLAIKAKLEVVETGIATLEEEFLSHIVLPSGNTVGQEMAPQLDQAYKTGKMPPLLGFSR